MNPFSKLPAILEGETVFVTGATSPTGSRMVRALAEQGARPRCLLHTPTHRDRIPKHPAVEIVEGSAESVETLRALTQDLDLIVNVAHIRFARNLIAALVERDRAARLVVISSTRRFSRFPSPVRNAVAVGEEAVMHAPDHVRWTLLRPTMIFSDARDNNIERVARSLRRTRLFPLFGRGENLVQPLFAQDLVQAILACLKNSQTQCRSYVLAGPEAMSYREMVRAVARAADLAPPIFISLPRAMSCWAARFGRALWKGFPIDPEMIERFGEDKAFSIIPARRDIGFDPTPFPEALRRKFSGDA